MVDDLLNCVPESQAVQAEGLMSTAEVLPVSEDLSTLGFTDAEVRALSSIARRKIRTLLIPTCGGVKLLQDAGNVRNIYKPDAWLDIHPQIRNMVWSQLVAFWGRRFQSYRRNRPYQMVIEIPFPYETPYKTSLVVDIREQGFSIISPFKAYLPAPSPDSFAR